MTDDDTTASRERALDVNVRSGPQMLEYTHIADRIAAEVSGSVLDWGCGWGQVTAMLRARGLEVEPYDYIEGESVRKIALEYGEGTRTISGEPIALPFADDQFDAVLSCGVLEHVQDPEASLDELHRVLRPGGRLYVYKLPNRRSYLEAIVRARGMYYHGALPYDTVYDLEEARQIVARHGYSVDEAQLANILPLTLTHPLAQRHAQRIWQANRWLARTPLKAFATNVEVIATAV